MRKIITLLFLFISICVYSQDVIPFDSETNEVVYTETKECALSKDQLFRNAKTWIAQNLTDYSKKIEMEDTAAGRIIVKYVDKVVDSRGGYDMLSFSLMIDCKEHKYRYKFYSIETESHIIMLDDIINIKRTMADYRQYVINSGRPEAKEKGLILNTFFKNMGSSLNETMSVDDDF